MSSESYQGLSCTSKTTQGGAQGQPARRQCGGPVIVTYCVPPLAAAGVSKGGGTSPWGFTGMVTDKSQEGSSEL